jgi:hypothetical protein
VRRRPCAVIGRACSQRRPRRAHDEVSKVKAELGVLAALLLVVRLRRGLVAADITVLLDDHEREQGAADRREWARTIAYDFTAPGKRLDEMSVGELEHEVERRVKYGPERGLIAYWA